MMQINAYSRVVSGGDYSYTKYYLHGAYHNFAHPTSRIDFMGFRCCKHG